MFARGHRFGRTAAFAAGAVVAAAALSAPSAFGADRIDPRFGPGGDRTAPSLAVDGHLSFVVGGQLDAVTATADDHCDAKIYHFSIPARFGWRTSDGRGGSGGVTSTVTIAIGDEPVVQGPSATTTYTWSAWDMPYPPCGGGGGVMVNPGFTVTATDAAGQRTSVGPVRFGVVRTVQEDGSSASGGFPVTVRRSGRWSAPSCDCSDAGRTWATSARGASVRYTVSTAAGQHLGLVMATGPDRGAVRVAVDGARPATVDTRASSARDRVVVADLTLGAGKHTVTVTNLATRGRPRVDVDALLLTAAPGNPG